MPMFDRRQLMPRWLFRLRLLLVFCLAMFTVSLSGSPIAFSAQTPNPGAPHREIRGVWLTNIDSDVLFDPQHLSDALKKLSSLHFNTVYPTVWNAGYTLYPSPVAKAAIAHAIDPRPEAKGLRDRDMLAETLVQAHSQGMSVIPWFEFGFMAPAHSELATLHPDWLTNQPNGDPIWMEGDEPRVWLNPFKPEVQQFIQALVLEIVSKYNVDGIQFDDHFGLPIEFGYDAYTLQLYQKENPSQTIPPNPQDDAWMRWRADKITAFLEQLTQAIKAQKRWVLVALSPNPLPFAYDAHLQDWSTWIQKGLIEELVVQIYRNDWEKFIERLNHPTVQDARTQLPTGIGILTGLKNRPVPIWQIREQVQEARKQGFAGVSFFFYETLWNEAAESADSRQSTFQAMFDIPTNRPNVVQGWSPPET